jgi:tRNA (guanine37-N1)-methyltransferase
MVEDVVRALRKLKLLDNSLEFGHEGESIVIPLAREPSDSEAKGLLARHKDLKIQQALLAEKGTAPKNLQEALRGQVKRDLIPSIPRSFDIIGDIAVVDLPDELGKLSSTIGSGILQINPNLRLVLAKSGKVSGTFRTRDFEVIAGAGSTETVYREFGCLYHLDVATVYFNPRLSHERIRVASQVRDGERVIDMFAGVGPYSILIAKKQPRAKVCSIDINPEAIKYLKENALLNQVAERLIPVLGDAKDIIARDHRGVASRVIMNLPADAMTFLPAAVQALREEGGILHYYAFAERNESLASMKEAVRSLIESQGRKVTAFSHAKAIKEVAPNRVQIAVDVLVK